MEAPTPAPSSTGGDAYTTSFEPIMIWSAIAVCLQVIILVFPGIYYSRVGISPPPARRSMSAISFNLLLPAMSFVNIGSTLTLDTLYQIWPFMVNAIFTNILGQICGLLACLLFRPPRRYWAHVQTSCGFGNLNSMPLLLTSALCGQANLPFYQYFGSVAECAGVGFGYVAIGSAANQILTYPLAIYLLKNKVEDGEDTRTADRSEKSIMEKGESIYSVPSLPPPGSPLTLPGTASPASPTSVAYPSSPVPGLHRSSIELAQRYSVVSDNGETGPPLKANKLVAKSSIVVLHHGEHPIGFWKNHSGRFIRLPEDDAPFGEEDGQAAFIDAAEDSLDLLALDSRRSLSYQTTTFLRRRPVGPDAIKVSKRVIGGSTANTLLVLATDESDDNDEYDVPGSPKKTRKHRIWRRTKTLWTLLRLYVFKPPAVGAIAGIVLVCIPALQNLLWPQAGAALGFISGSLTSISNALVFVSSFVVGGSMSKGPGDGTKLIGWRVCTTVCMIRFVALPIIGSIIVIGAAKLGIYSPTNPVYLIILVLQWCVPTANQMQNIASMYENHESAMGTLIFWQYAAMLFFVPLWLCINLLLFSAFDVYDTIS